MEHKLNQKKHGLAYALLLSEKLKKNEKYSIKQ